MAFAENLKQLPSIANIERLELFDREGKFVATIENKPGQTGSLAVYHHLVRQYGAIDATAATEGLLLYAEHTKDAEKNPGKHPNIDRLLAVIGNKLALTATIHSKA